MSGGAVAAVDLGATSGRVVVGRVGRGLLEIQDVHRFDNTPVRTADGLHWDILDLYRNVLLGLREALRVEPGLRSVGICSWAVDYGLVRGTRLVSVPYHYRDPRCDRGVRAVHEVVDPQTLYAGNGLQFLPFNTLYQLAVDRDEGILDDTTRMLLVPDLLAFWLTGACRAERTNASTTGLVDVRAGGWHRGLIESLGLPPALFPPLVEPGDRIGALTEQVAEEVGGARLDVVAVGSHDTASAVVAVPMRSARSAYICSGTWSLIGTEIDAPLVSPASRAANFTNEAGVDGRVRYLRNAMGMWVLNECVSAWEREDGADADLTALVRAAGETTEHVLFDVDDPSLLPAGDMPTRVLALAPRLRGADRAVVVRSILESLAVSYASTLDELEGLTGRPVEDVHIVGGPSQNRLLCQLIADRSGRRVHAGPVEATAIGNVLVQARASGLVAGGLKELRALTAETQSPVTHRPGAGVAQHVSEHEPSRRSGRTAS